MYHILSILCITPSRHSQCTEKYTHSQNPSHTLQHMLGVKRPDGEKRSRTPRPKEFAWKGADWDGNSDDEGSVDSAILEESICYGCGKSTVGALSSTQTILLSTIMSPSFIHYLPFNDVVIHQPNIPSIFH